MGHMVALSEPHPLKLAINLAAFSNSQCREKGGQIIQMQQFNDKGSNIESLVNCIIYSWL